MPKKIPMRTCIGCQQIRPKKEMFRIVLTPEGELQMVRSGRANGRGAYLCDDLACLEKAVKKKSFSRAFHAQVSPQSIDRLMAEAGGTDAG